MDFLKRTITIAIASVSPFIMLLCFGEKQSLSQYYTTDAHAIFILTNVLTAYFFLSLPEWKYSGVCLTLLTAFSVEHYQDFHNIIAIIFFVTAFIALYRAKRFIWYSWIYVACLSLLFISILWAEIAGILVLCAYHFHILIYKEILESNRAI